MSEDEKFTVKDKLIEIMAEIKELRHDLHEANKAQDERITMNSTFRTNALAVMKVLLIIISGAAGGISLYIFGP